MLSHLLGASGHEQLQYSLVVPVLAAFPTAATCFRSPVQSTALVELTCTEKVLDQSGVSPGGAAPLGLLLSEAQCDLCRPEILCLVPPSSIEKHIFKRFLKFIFRESGREEERKRNIIVREKH